MVYKDLAENFYGLLKMCNNSRNLVFCRCIIILNGDVKFQKCLKNVIKIAKLCKYFQIFTSKQIPCAQTSPDNENLNKKLNRIKGVSGEMVYVYI